MNTRLYIKFLLAVIAIAISAPAIAQESKEISKIHLKDGSTLVGVIIEDNNYFIKLSTATMDTLEIGYKLILGIGEKVNVQKYRANPIKIKDKGIFATASIGLLEEGRGNFDEIRLGLVVGKRLNDRLNLGIEIGMQGHTFTSNFAWGDSDFITAGLYAKYFLSTKSNRWFFDGTIGYGFAQAGESFQDYAHDYNGGVNTAFNIGRQWGLSNTVGLFFKLGVGYQHVTGEIFTNWNGAVTTSYRKEFIYPSFLIGVEF